MSWLTTAAYVLFFLSVFIPVYTYGLYPLILLFFRKKQYESNDVFLPEVSVLVVPNKDENLTNEKLESLRNLKYPNYEVLTCEKGICACFPVIEIDHTQKTSELNALLKASRGDIILFTDHKTPIDSLAVGCLVRHFADNRVGCVVGQLRSDSPSVFWKYENYIRWQEGKAGRVSGANSAIYAVRKEYVKSIPENIINVEFFVPTVVQQEGHDVLFDSDAVAYEQPGAQADHVSDGAGYYQALRVFWRMLLPRKGSFVYWSHRVLKWLTPFCMIMAFISSAICSFTHLLTALVWLFQFIGYGLVCFYYQWEKARFDLRPKGLLHKFFDIVVYFVELNVSYIVGFFKQKK